MVNNPAQCNYRVMNALRRSAKNSERLNSHASFVLSNLACVSMVRFDGCTLNVCHFLRKLWSSTFPKAAVALIISFNKLILTFGSKF